MGRKPILPQGANAFTAGAQLRQLRLNRNISLKDMAERLTYSKGYLSAVENGKERVHKELLERYETALGIEKEELSGLLQVQRSTSLSDTIEYLVKNASTWTTALEKASIRKEKVRFLMEKGDYRLLSHQADERDWQYHLELALRNAAEQGLMACKTYEERDHYRNLLAILSEPGSLSDEIRFSALHQFISSDVPDLESLNIACNRLLNIHILEHPFIEVDMKPYISSFMKALIAHVYTDSFFKPQIDKLIGMHISSNAYRKPIDIIVTLNQVYDTLSAHYSPEQFGRDVVTYAEYVERRLRHLKLLGIVPKDKNSDPELNNTFVPLRVTLQDQSSLETSSDASLLALLEQYSYIVLLGGPGSGKSTSAHHLAWSHAVANLSNPFNMSLPILSGSPLPLRIELRRLSEDRRHHHEYDFLTYAAEVFLRGEDVKINPQMFQTLLERRAMLLIFDGLDEVATLDERKQLVHEIERFALNYPGNRILVTSRPVGYELAPCSRHQFEHARVQEFNNTQIQQFLHNWYAYVLKQTILSKDDQEELNKLSDILHNDQRLRKLAENPLLLTVITALHRYERLPDKRALVYDRCADLLLNTWARLKGTDTRWKDLKMTKDDQYACVAHLGYVLHQQSQENENRNETVVKIEFSLHERASDVPTLFLLQEIERFLRERRLITGVDEQRAEAKRFLDLMQEEAGLIVVRGTDSKGVSLYGFVHRTFQEYFAAAYIYEQFQQEVDISVISAFLKEHLHDPHWHEVILLLLGKLKPKPVTNLLKRILTGEIESYRSSYRNILKQDLLFVSSCLVEEIEVQQELVEEVISLLIDLVKSAPFPLLRAESLAKLYLLIQTRQYASLALDALIALIQQRPLLDIDIHLKIALILFRSNFTSKDAQVAVGILEHLAQNHDQVLAQALKKMIRESQSWLKESQSIFELLRHFIRCTNLSTRLTIDVALELYQLSPKESQEKQQTAQMILQLVQRHDLPIEQAIQSVALLYRVSPKESQDEQLIAKFINYLAQRLDVSSTKEVIQWLGSLNPATRVSLNRMFIEKRQIIKNLLVSFAQRSDLPIEETIQDIEALYQDFSNTSVERNIVAQMLVSFAQRSDLSVGQSIQVVETLNKPTMQIPSERRLRNQQLLELSQRPDLSVEQAIWIAQNLAPVLLDRYTKEEAPGRNKITEVLASFARRPDLSVEEAIQIAQNLLMFGEDEFALSLSITLLFHVAQDQTLTLKQRLEAIKVLFSIKSITWREVVQTVHIVLSLFNEEEARNYLNEFWPVTERWPIQSSVEVMLSDAPYLAELAQQELLPIRARNKVYYTLRSLIPKFDGFAFEK